MTRLPDLKTLIFPPLSTYPLSTNAKPFPTHKPPSGVNCLNENNSYKSGVVSIPDSNDSICFHLSLTVSKLI